MRSGVISTVVRNDTIGSDCIKTGTFCALTIDVETQNAFSGNQNTYLLITLPDDLIQKTFDQWIEHLSKNTDPMFRTIDQLNLDREKFAKLRARAKKKNGAK